MRIFFLALLFPLGCLQAESAPMLDQQIVLERGLEFAFRHAESVLRVEAGEFVEQRLRVEVNSALHGFRVPRTMFLDGVGPESGVTKGSRWLVASANHQGAGPNRFCIARLPDTPENRGRVKSWAFPIHQLTPLVFTATIRESGGRIIFQRHEVLRGRMNYETVDDNDWEYPILWPSTEPHQLYLVAAWSETLIKNQDRKMVHVRSIQPIMEEELPVLRRTMKQWNGKAVLAESKRSEQKILEMFQAWQFNRAPLVAESRMVVAGEIIATGAGGTYVSLMAEKMLRGGKPERIPIEKQTIDLFGRSGFSPAALFVMGGHAFHFGKLPEKVLSAGWSQGGRVVVYLPFNDDNRKRVTHWVAMPPPRFACHVMQPSVLPVTEDLFDGAVPPPLANTGMVPGVTGSWIGFQVMRRASTTIAGQPAESMRLRQIPDPKIGVPPQLKDWSFYAVKLPDWPVESRWWGYALPAGPLGEAKDWVFVPSLFLPQNQGIDLNHLLRVAAEDLRFLRYYLDKK